MFGDLVRPKKRKFDKNHVPTFGLVHSTVNKMAANVMTSLEQLTEVDTRMLVKNYRSHMCADVMCAQYIQGLAHFHTIHGVYLHPLYHLGSLGCKYTAVLDRWTIKGQVLAKYFQGPEHFNHSEHGKF